MHTSENNWYKWYYSDLPAFSRQVENLEFRTEFTKFTGDVGSFKEELLKAAKSTMDYCVYNPVILFSGGVDSEIMLRAFLDIGIKPEIIIARYEKDYNLYDVSYAVTICSMLDVEYKIFDFNLQKFYENEAEKYSELAQIDRPRALPYCGLLDKVDGFPIMGASDLSPMRPNGDYSIDVPWFMRCWEHDIGYSKFLRQIHKPGIAEWFKWTPGLVISYMKLPWFKNLVHNKIYGKQGSNSSKIIGYRDAYPDLISRKKQTGFEKIDILVEEMELFLSKKNNGFLYRNMHDRSVPQLWNELTGEIWNEK